MCFLEVLAVCGKPELESDSFSSHSPVPRGIKPGFITASLPTERPQTGWRRVEATCCDPLPGDVRDRSADTHGSAVWRR